MSCPQDQQSVKTTANPGKGVEADLFDIYAGTARSDEDSRRAVTMALPILIPLALLVFLLTFGLANWI